MTGAHDETDRERESVPSADQQSAGRRRAGSSGGGALAVPVDELLEIPGNRALNELCNGGMIEERSDTSVRLRVQRQRIGHWIAA